METFTLILAIVCLVFGILQIILFFKVWNMTNNVAGIKALYEKQNSEMLALLKNKIPNGMSFELLFMTQCPIIFPTSFLIAQKQFLTGNLL